MCGWQQYKYQPCGHNDHNVHVQCNSMKAARNSRQDLTANHVCKQSVKVEINVDSDNCPNCYIGFQPPQVIQTDTVDGLPFFLGALPADFPHPPPLAPISASDYAGDYPPSLDPGPESSNVEDSNGANGETAASTTPTIQGGNSTRGHDVRRGGRTKAR